MNYIGCVSGDPVYKKRDPGAADGDALHASDIAGNSLPAADAITDRPTQIVTPLLTMPAVTVYSVASVVDLSPTHPDDQKRTVIVRRASGTYDKIPFPPH